MVQVDIFWSYGIGAGLALAASRHLVQADSSKKNEDYQVSESVNSPFFTKTILFLSMIFAPSGLWLLWEFTSWETMHALTRDMPVWLVALFAITNISQGALAFIVCHWCIKKGKQYLAYLQFFFAYFGMFFILVHGWDGRGYQRFFSSRPEQLQDWTWATAAQWFSSDVALTLYGMGVVIIPLLVGLTHSWLKREGQSSTVPALSFLGSIFLGSLGSAILASLIIHSLGWIAGSIVALALVVMLVLPRTRIMFQLYRGMLA